MSGITLKQIKALFKEELTPLKEAVASMEAKLGEHDASFEDVKLRLGVLEDAPVQSGIDEKVKSAISTEMKIVYDSIPG